MKSFLLFAGHEYYPRGGALDFKGAFDTLEEATLKGASVQLGPKENYSMWNWFHVADAKSLEIVKSMYLKVLGNGTIVEWTEYPIRSTT